MTENRHDIMARIWNLPPSVDRTQRLIMYNLYSHLNHKDGLCNPKHTTIARECGITVRSVERNIKALRDENHLKVERVGRENRYEFFPTPVSGKNPTPVSGDGAGIPDASVAKYPTPVSGRYPTPVSHKATEYPTPVSPPIIEEPITDKPEIEPEHNRENPPAKKAQADIVDLLADSVVVSLAKRLAKLRQKDAGLTTCKPQAVEYYTKLLSGIAEEGEVTLDDLEVIVRWFETTPDGQATFSHGMGNLAKNYQHVLRRNVANYLKRAKGGHSKRLSPSEQRLKAYGARITQHDPETVQKLDPNDIPSQEVDY